MDFSALDQEAFFFFEMLNGSHMPAPPAGLVLTEDDFFVLTEDGGRVEVE